MKMRNFITCFFTIIVMLIFLQHHLVASFTPINQKIALFQFKQSLSISPPTNCSYYSYTTGLDYEIPSHPKTMNWSMSSDYCTWEGVSCDQKTGDVIGLDLSCGQLEGAIYPNSTLFQLSHLQFLNLSWNDFYLSGQFPQEFGFFAKGLTHLNLSKTGFSGRVPSGISRLYELVSLDLSRTYGAKLEDEVFKSLLQNLTQLRVLNLRFVNIISSVLPVNLSTSLRVLNLAYTHLHGVVPQEVFHLPNLEVLDLSTFPTWRSSYLSSGDLTATLPKVKWGSSATLQYLDLHFINIDGGIPDSIGFLESLRTLVLSYCNLSGVVPQEVFHLPNLEELALYSSYYDVNNLTTTLPKVKWGSSATLQYLHLEGINIDGGIPDSIGFSESLRSLDLFRCNLSGVVPQEVFHLPNLERLALSSYDGINLTATLPKVKWGSSATLQQLNLGFINIHGGIPDSIGFLKSLRSLDLSYCNLSGPIPRSIGSLGQLTSLGLSFNNLNGPIPNVLANLTNLTDLNLYYNNLTGPIPPRLFDLSSLQSLYLNDNGFTGQLHEFDSFKSKLDSFYCGNNLLNGPIPQSFSRLVSLTQLDFSSNNFSGILDLEMFSGLESLEHLDLSHNSLSVRSASMATLPPKLEYLGLSSCNMKEFPHFSRDAEIIIDHLDLSNNQIEGEIPHWIGFMGTLTYLNLSHNTLTGGLEQLHWNNIQYLDLHSNMLNGSLPTLICNSSRLEILNLSHNNLSGALPVCSENLTSILVFDLRMNKIQGNIPATLSNFRSLETINLHGNKLQGRIPSSFAQFDSLQVLDLGSNQINDTFPQCLEALPNLQVLVLKSNKFHGLINTSSKIEHPFPSLKIIDLSYNEFLGPLPAIYFKNFKAMMNGEVNETKPRYMGNNYYSDSTALVIKGVEIQLVRILTVFTTIDVSRNDFEGEIVEYIGNLASLRYLNLSHNQLTGHIPSSIGKLSMLESLDLSFNRLKGGIPQQLTGIYSLARLNLSHNRLSGHIPQGFQFNTFDNDSYVDNLGLCGLPLSRDCEHNFETQKEGEVENNFFNGFTWEAVVIGYGCGVVPAFIIGYLMLLTGKPKWYAGIIGRELGLKIRRMEIKMRF